jgi:hypothetical protein
MFFFDLTYCVHSTKVYAYDYILQVFQRFYDTNQIDTLTPLLEQLRSSMSYYTQSRFAHMA